MKCEELDRYVKFKINDIVALIELYRANGSFIYMAFEFLYNLICIEKINVLIFDEHGIKWFSQGNLVRDEPYDALFESLWESTRRDPHTNMTFERLVEVIHQADLARRNFYVTLAREDSMFSQCCTVIEHTDYRTEIHFHISES